MKVLVVDDSIYIRTVIKNAINNIQVELFEANNGDSALNIIKDEAIDIMFLDWNIPILNGLEVVKKISETEIWNRIKIVMVTSEAAKYNIMEALEAGVSEYLVKPITPIIIKEVFNKFTK